MDNNPSEPAQSSSLDKVAAALAELGEATAAAIATQAGTGYSTATKQLRALEETGQARPLRGDDGRTLWKPTPTGDNPVRSRCQHSEPDGDNLLDIPDQASVAQRTPAAAGDSPQALDEHPDGNHPTDEPAPQGDASERVQPDVPTGGIGSQEQRPVSLETTASGDNASLAGPDLGHRVGARLAIAAPPAPDATDAGPSNPDTAAATDSAANPASVSERRTPARPRRGKGELRNAVLTLLRKNPDTSYKVSEICRLLDQATDSAEVNKASAGAVANALDKLAGEHTVQRLDATPATYQAV